jgi:hypothetical protein
VSDVDEFYRLLSSYDQTNYRLGMSLDPLPMREIDELSARVGRLPLSLVAFLKTVGRGMDHSWFLAGTDVLWNEWELSSWLLEIQEEYPDAGWSGGEVPIAMHGGYTASLFRTDVSEEIFIFHESKPNLKLLATSWHQRIAMSYIFEIGTHLRRSVTLELLDLAKSCSVNIDDEWVNEALE